MWCGISNLKGIQIIILQSFMSLILFVGPTFVDVAKGDRSPLPDNPKVPRPYFHQITLKATIFLLQSANSFLIIYNTIGSCTRLVLKISKTLTA